MRVTHCHTHPRTMGNGCTFKGQSDAPVVDEDGDGDGDKRGQQPKGKQIRVVLVDSDCTDSEVDEAVKRILKGGNPVGGKKKNNDNDNNSSAFDSSSASEAPPSSAASPTSPVSHEEPELIAKGVPIKKKKLLLKMGKKGRKVGKQSKSKSGKSASKKKSMSTPLSSLASSANSSPVDSSSVQPPPPLIKQPAKVNRKEIIKSTGPPTPPPAKTKTKNADSTFFSSPLRLPSDSEQENSSIPEEKGKGKLNLIESTQIQSSDDGGGGGSSSSDNANDAHTH